MGERRIINGAIYEKTPEGIVLVGPAPSAVPSAAPTAVPLPQSPKDQREAARQAAADARADAAGTRADAQLELARQANARAERVAAGDPVANAKQMAEWRGNLQNIGLLEKTVKELRKQYEEHFKGKGPLKSLEESYAPVGLAPQYGVFESKAQSMIADMAKAKGLTATQFNTPAEAKMFFEPLVPKRGDPDEVIVSKLDTIEQMLQGGRRTTMQNLGMDVAAGAAQQQADNEVPDPTTGADLKPPPTDGSPDELPPANEPQTFGASGSSRREYSPKLSALVDSMVNAGAGLASINAALKTRGVGPIEPKTYAAAKQWMKENPGKRYYGASIDRDLPLTALQRIAGSPLGAGAARYANSATAGTVGALAGESGKGALAAMGQMHPNASLLGDVAGGITGALGAEGAIAARAPAALAQYAPRIADTLYGGLTGFNAAEEGQGLQGAALGAGAGLAGGYLGQRLMQGVGGAVRGVADPAVQRLREAGVPLTVGQVVGKGGLLGRSVRGMEDRLTGFPLVGDVVNARRTEGVEAFADKMANDAVAPIGGTATGYGQPMVDDLLQQGGDAYTRATAGAHVPLDPQFATDMQQVRALGSILPPDLAGRFGQAIDNRVGPIEADAFMTGDSFQQGVRGLKGYRAETPKPGFEQDYRDALGQGIDALKGQMTRGGGQDVVDNLAKADQAWKQIKIIEKATQAAKNGARSGEVGLPMPSQFNDAAQAAANKFGGPRFNSELLDAGQSLLPSRVGDSGTAGRVGVGVLLGGIGAGAGGVAGSDGGLGGTLGGASAGGLGTVLLLAAGGSKPAQRTLVNILASRPDLARQIGGQIADHSGIGGWSGAGVLTPLFVGQ